MTDTSKKSEVIVAAKDEKVAQLVKFIPKGQSPKVFVELINQQILGVTKQGQPRPFTDLMYFLYVCDKTKLDPLTKQIYAVYRWDFRTGEDKMVIQVGIDGFRLIAQRSKEYAGQDDVVFTPLDETTKYPTKASVTVYKLNKITGERMPVVASARWTEYAQYTGKEKALNPMWEKMPYNQLGKCAEALCLRKAFPNELSGLYIPEEIQVDTNSINELPTPKGKEKKVLTGKVSETKEKTAPKPVESQGKASEKPIDLGKMRSNLTKPVGSTGEEVIDPEEVDKGIKKMEEEKK